MERKSVSSSNIDSIGYDADSATLEIAFLSGGLYQYYDVPEYVYDELMSAGSHGSYFAAKIKNVYSYSKV